MGRLLRCDQGHDWEWSEGGATLCPRCGLPALTPPPDPGITDHPAPVARHWPTIPGYEILAELGGGGMGIVYQARDLMAGRLVALKVIRPDRLRGLPPKQARAWLDRFRREAKTLASLDHPNIVRVYEVGDHDGEPYFSLEFCDGGSLQGRITDSPLGPAEAARLLAVLARAVEAAHRRNVIHRDLKPANVLFAGDTPRLNDFGLAKHLKGPQSETPSVALAGTPCYMPPEQAMGREAKVGFRSDVYGLGAILYHCLTGRPPFQGQSQVEVLQQLFGSDPLPPRRLRPGIPVALETICLRCLEKKPSRRYESAADLAEQLTLFLNDKPITDRPVGALGHVIRWAERKPVLAGLLAAVAVAILVAAWVGGRWFVAAALAREMTDLRDTAVTLQKEAERNETEAKDARENAERLKGEAERLKHIAEGESAEAKKQKARAEEQEELVRQVLYGSQMKQGERAWQDGQVVQLTRLLDEQRPEVTNKPDLRHFEWRYLHQLCRASHTVFHGHLGVVTSVAFHPGGQQLASAGIDGTVKLWDAATAEELATLRPNAGSVFDLAYGPDGKQLVTAGADGTAKVWDPSTGRELRTLTAGPGQVKCVAYSPDGGLVAVAVQEGGGAFQGQGKARVTLWETTTWSKKSSLDGIGYVGGVAFSPDSGLLAVGRGDGVVEVWDVKTTKSVARFQHSAGQVRGVSAVAFDPAGGRVASVGLDGVIKVWNRADRKQLLLLRRPAPLSGLAFSPDGTRLASDDQGGLVKVWDATSGAEILALKGHTNEVFRVAFSPDGRRVATASADRTLRLWDLELPQEALTARREGSPIWGTVLSPDGRFVYSVAERGRLEMTDLRTRRPVESFRKSPAPAGPMAISPKGDLLALPTRQGARLVRANSGALVKELVGHSAGVFSVAFDETGTRLASAGLDGTVGVWDVEAGTRVKTLTGHASHPRSPAEPPRVYGVAFGRGGLLASSGGEVILWDLGSGKPRFTFSNLPTFTVYCVAFSPDGKRLAAGCSEGTVKVWDSATGREELSLRGHASAIMTLAFSEDGRRLATGGMDKTLKLWDAATGQEVQTLRGHTGVVLQLSLSRDGDRLASCGEDGTVRVWEAPPIPPVLHGHTGEVRQVAYSPDGKRLASAALDNTVKVWDSRTGAQLASYAHAEPVHGVSFSPDGAWLASGSTRGTVRVWDAATGQESRTWEGHTGDVGGVAFTPDGKRLASASVDTTVKVWECPTGRELVAFKGHTAGVLAVAAGQGGKCFASGGIDKTVRAWDGDTGRQLWSAEQDNWVVSVAFSLDGKRLAAGISEGKVVILDALSGKLLHTIELESRVVRVLFTPDGRHLATVVQLRHELDKDSHSTVIKLWDAATFRRAVTLPVQPLWVWGLAIDPDCSRLATAGEDNLIRSWDMPAVARSLPDIQE